MHVVDIMKYIEVIIENILVAQFKAGIQFPLTPMGVLTPRLCPNLLEVIGKVSEL